MQCYANLLINMNMNKSLEEKSQLTKSKARRATPLQNGQIGTDRGLKLLLRTGRIGVLG
jgi:hypothetical protein